MQPKTNKKTTISGVTRTASQSRLGRYTGDRSKRLRLRIGCGDSISLQIAGKRAPKNPQPIVLLQLKIRGPKAETDEDAGSRPRHPAWEIGVQLKTKSIGAYGLHFESM